MDRPGALACDSAGDLFALVGGNIDEFTPSGVQLTIASGLNGTALAFNGAGDLFEADNSGHTYDMTQGRTFASGLSLPSALAFNSAGDLFVIAGWNIGVIYKFTPGGVQSTFASGLPYSYDMTFQTIPEPSISCLPALGATAFPVRYRRNP